MYGRDDGSSSSRRGTALSKRNPLRSSTLVDMEAHDPLDNPDPEDGFKSGGPSPLGKGDVATLLAAGIF